MAKQNNRGFLQASDRQPLLFDWIFSVDHQRIGLLLMFVNLFRGMRSGATAGSNPWQAATLEWVVSSPPPIENFAQPPQVTHDPYDLQQAGKP